MKSAYCYSSLLGPRWGLPHGRWGRSTCHPTLHQTLHTERRIRELRELGLRIDSVKRDGVGCCLLTSLDLDPDQTKALVIKAIKKPSVLEAEQEKLIAAVDA
ncbi:hypothetical protein [Streptomyces sp. KO7888]|uniref:hypothetical protein n=1 Tax=Streptomyces sp. KO7888 TaxID=2602737 RepID=UPI0013F5AC66|nr:hypothetical protein [Streptomyces sp. KO7888]